MSFFNNISTSVEILVKIYIITIDNTKKLFYNIITTNSYMLYATSY
jgi:hypothetical protein